MASDCDRSGHLQNGKPARRKNPGKIGKKMENGARPKMAEKWPPKWKNGGGALKWDFQPFSHFCGHFSAIAGPGPFSFPFSRDFCAGPVSHSVSDHFDRKPQSLKNYQCQY